MVLLYVLVYKSYKPVETDNNNDAETEKVTEQDPKTDESEASEDPTNIESDNEVAE